jgi:hypothetical protein
MSRKENEFVIINTNNNKIQTSLFYHIFLGVHRAIVRNITHHTFAINLCFIYCLSSIQQKLFSYLVHSCFVAKNYVIHTKHILSHRQH